MGFFSGIVAGVVGFFASGGNPYVAAAAFYAGWDVSTEGGFVDIYQESIIEDMIMPMPELGASPTYRGDQVRNTIGEGYPCGRCYGLCKVGGNKLRFNAPDATDLRIIVAHCVGEVEGIVSWDINDIDWDALDGAHTKTEYKGDRTQVLNNRFSSRASAYRSIAYTAFTFVKNDKQIGYDPNITVIMQGLLCAPLAGGADAFTRNPAVILYDWYLNVEGYSAGDLDLNAFKSLEEFCDEVPTGGSLPRYRFDFNFDAAMSINDGKKLIWQSFNGRSIMSQGKIKPVWDAASMADGGGSLTAKTSSYSFNVDNVEYGQFSWKQPDRPNLVRIHFKDSEKKYKSSSVEEADEQDIDRNGEILYEEKCWWITDAEIARRRAKFKFDKFKYTDYEVRLKGLSGAGILEVYDKTDVTHTLGGWAAKDFIVTGRAQDHHGRNSLTLKAYYSGVYDDAQVGEQPGYESQLPNPFDAPAAASAVAVAEVTAGESMSYGSISVDITPPPTEPFYSYSEVYISNDDSTYYFAGTTSGETLIIQGMGMFYQPGDTVYIKTRTVSDTGIFGAMTAADNTVVVSTAIRLGGFYAGLTTFGDNAIPNNAKILLDKSNTLIRVGPTGSDHIIIDGDYGGVPAIVTSNYVSGIHGAGLLLKSDLLEVGNVAVRGLIRTAVFQKDVVSAVGGNLVVLPADVLDADTITENRMEF